MVEGTGLENRRAGNSTEGSNPSLSAKKLYKNNLLFSAGYFLSVKYLDVGWLSVATTVLGWRRII